MSEDKEKKLGNVLGSRIGGARSQLTRRKDIFANAAYLSGARVAQLVASLTVGIYVARYLGPSDWGKLTYVVSFVGMFSGIATLGLDNIVVRDLASAQNGNEAQKDILSAAFVLKTIAGILTLILICGCSWLVSNGAYTTGLVMIVASAILFQPLSVIDLHYQSRVLSKFVVRVQICVLLVTSVARIVLVTARAPVVAFAWMIFTDTTLAMLGLASVYRPASWYRLRWHANRALVLGLLRDSWPLAVTGILTAIYINVDRVMIREMLGDASAGQYAVVLNISTSMYFVPLVLGQSVFPSLVAARSDLATYHRYLQHCFDLSLWGAILVALPVSLCAESLIRMLYGAAYAGGSGALAIHIWCAVVTLLGVVSSYWLVAENLQHLYPLRIFASLCVCVTLNLLLIPRIGLPGAAVATLVAQFVSSTVVFAFDARTRLMPRMQLGALAFPLRIWRVIVDGRPAQPHE